jgi:mevalonate kinase
MDSFNAQRSHFPAMVSPAIEEVIDRYRDQALAWKLAGAGGGGYMALVTEKPLDNAIRIKIRRKGF